MTSADDGQQTEWQKGKHSALSSPSTLLNDADVSDKWYTYIGYYYGSETIL